ncbi:polyhydroxyalkanoate synthesis repressor PhaR [Hyphomicrobium sp. LHD-15]|uniref:polyhydroxyalkanoate synthesis repressor PhaR n=1 Tax=Hyphomicrobium sp. LHD-15 TaxID=3072142 RepID=UPI00280E38AB|nr:polyhydroxyalkanoate synthesis repressor PhaR [Hyphomicrobium sp. LHD-15]MDQ8698791.1 polyhydroxyalkanoate synthesis repressor PhaR [Hyphomicrobium sp. LHD-15]
MAQPMLNKSEALPEKKESVVIKKYANRRLYNTETSTYVTLEDLAQMVRNDKDFVVYDAKSGDDLTHAVLTQIIVEQESRQGGQTLLPIPFLRQLIRFYDDNIGSMVPSYLQFSLENLVKEQEKFRTMFASAFSNPAAAFEAYQDQARKNMAMFEQAMSMWTSFGGAANFPGKMSELLNEEAAKAAAAASSEAPKGEIDELKAQLSAMQQRIERLAKDRD